MLSNFGELRKARVKDPELFELKRGSLDLLLLYQHVEKLKTNPPNRGERNRYK